MKPSSFSSRRNSSLALPSSFQKLHVPRGRSGKSPGTGLLLLAGKVTVPPGPSPRLLRCLKAP